MPYAKIQTERPKVVDGHLMQQQTKLELNPAAWFFVSETDDDAAQSSNIQIQPPFRIGRKPELELFLPCQSVSGLHAEIIEQDDVLWLVDLDSTNGTFVNGKRINSPFRLTHCDTVQFGTAVFHVSQSNQNEFKPSVSDGPSNAEDKSIQDERLERLFNGGVVPFFQPIVSLNRDKQQVIGYEVLGRSRLYGLKTPAQMFAAASRLELEADLSRTLRKQGITVADKNLDVSQTLFVNTHPAELEISGLEESLFEIREEYPDRPIMMEVHESAVKDIEKFQRIRSTLENLSIGLAIHDFGSGEIRLASLVDICPNVVKFDVNLLQGIDKASQRNQQFLASLVAMMKDLGIKPMAERIEHEGEHQAIVEMGFELGQGFHYGRPTSISDCPATTSTPQFKSFSQGADDSDAAADKPNDDSVGKPKDAQWLLEQSKNHFTIQVLSAISEARANEHILAQENPGDFSIFCKQGKTRTLYIVCYGLYEDRAAAKVVAEQIADATISPWIRMLSSIHAEIEK